MYIYLLEVCCSATRFTKISTGLPTKSSTYLPTYLRSYRPTCLALSLSLSLVLLGFFSNFKFRGTVGMRLLRAEMAERMAISAFLIAPGIAGRARGPPSTKHKAR
jgi:hypothetical protein